MKLLSTLTALSLALAGCWGQDNPLDPGRCEPACGAGFRCVDGRCLALEHWPAYRIKPVAARSNRSNLDDIVGVLCVTEGEDHR